MAIIPETKRKVKLAGDEEGNRKTMSGDSHISRDKEEAKVQESTEAEELKWYEEAIILVATAFFLLSVVISIVMVLYGIFRNSVYIGYGILALIPTGYSLYTGEIIIQVPEKKRFMVSAFKKYYKTLRPGLHFVVPYVMQVDRELTLAATKMFDIYMRKGSARLEVVGGTIGVDVKVFLWALNPYSIGYLINISNEEISAIEQREIDMGLLKLPENWMYYVATVVEASLRGIFGRYTIDDVIEARAVPEKKDQVRPEIIEEVEKEVNSRLKRYDIEIEQIALSAIELGPDLEKARNQIQIEKEGVRVKEQKFRQAKIDADIEEQKGIGQRRRLDATAGDIEVTEEVEKNGKKIRKVVKKIPSGMTRADVMRWEAAMKTTDKVKDITVLTGGKDEPIPLEVAARMGAAFRTGSDAAERKKKSSEEKSQEKEEETKEKPKEEESENKPEETKEKTETKMKKGETKNKKETKKKYKEE